MASTNKTTNYELSQFLGTDKPAWLSDYNSDMSKIDTQMKANADAATSAGGAASSANTAIGNLTNLTTDVKTDLVSAINEVDSNADTAQGTATNASTTANSAYTIATALKNYLTLGNHRNLTLTASSTSGAVGVYYNTFKSAYNSDGSLGKIYGQVVLEGGTGARTFTLNFSDTGLRPNEQITINSAITYEDYGSTGTFGIRSADITIKTDGTATAQFSVASNKTGINIIMIPFVIFAENFGD